MAAVVSLLCSLAVLSVVRAATITHDFNISWVRGNPDGLFDRPVMGINGQWPIPALTVTKGDRLVVNVLNQLGNETTSLHWHGIFQTGTPHMDGPVGVSQCEIPPGGSFVYNFTIDQPGTYWFHSHTRGQYPDGLRAPLIVLDTEDPYKDQYDEQIVLSFSDWYHDLMKPLLASFVNVANPTGAEPVPNSALVNDTQNLTVAVQPGKTYMLRMVNMAAFAAVYVWFEGHSFKIVEVDGVYTEPADADQIYITTAQRYSVLLTTKNDTATNFPFVASMDEDLFDTVPDSLNPNVTGWLVYDSKNSNPDPAPLDPFDPFDDYTLVPYDGDKLYDNVNYTMTLDMKMDNLGDGANYAFFNDISYVGPKVPTLYTVLSSGSLATNPQIYGTNTNPYVLSYGDVVEIILNNNDPGKHPFHLHGHEFQLVTRSDEEAGNYDPTNTTTPPAVPMRRDTVLVRPDGHIVLRFRAQNPGIWLFHCHIEWHMSTGLAITFVEAPLVLQQILKSPLPSSATSNFTSEIPASHFSACAANDPATPTLGNAAGNTVDLLDLKGEPAPPSPLPAGFEAKGIVALVFSCVAAFLGLAVISWYGMNEVHEKKPVAATIGGNTGYGALGKEGVAVSGGEKGEEVGAAKKADAVGGDGIRVDR